MKLIKERNSFFAFELGNVFVKPSLEPLPIASIQDAAAWLAGALTPSQPSLPFAPDAVVVPVVCIQLSYTLPTHCRPFADRKGMVPRLL